MDANTLVAGCVFGVSLFLYTRLKQKKDNGEVHHDVKNGDDFSIDPIIEKSNFDKEAWRAAFFDPSRVRKVSANLLIKYDNNNGLIEEAVAVEQTDNYLGKSVFRAFCQTRQVYDTFFYDFIRSCTDLDTGEPVEDVEQYLYWKYENSSEETIDLISCKYVDLLKALYFMAENNGSLNDQSLETVRLYFCGLTGDDRLTAEQCGTLFIDLNAGDDTFEQSIARAGLIEEVELEEFLKCCEEIAGAEKTFSSAHKVVSEHLKLQS